MSAAQLPGAFGLSDFKTNPKPRLSLVRGSCNVSAVQNLFVLLVNVSLGLAKKSEPFPLFGSGPHDLSFAASN